VRHELSLQQISKAGEMLERKILKNAEAAKHVEQAEVVALTKRATLSTFYTDDMTPEQLKANQRIPMLSGPCFFEAARSINQHLAAAFDGVRLTGFMIATRHGPDDLELDWLMVDPDEHGRGTAAALMQAGLDWLGPDRSIWLTVIRHNHRAIGFYRKFGFEIDAAARLARPVPSCIMRRQPPSPLRGCSKSCGSLA
jgi:ribosomal protein S18 acetylase RimI-like enzyme